MTNYVYWMLELEIQSGREAEFQVLMTEMVAATLANEPGALNYEWSTSENGKTCYIFERYVDSDATMVHLANFGEKFAGRFLEILNPTSFKLFGSPNQAVRDAVAGFGAVFMPTVGGFSR